MPDRNRSFRPLCCQLVLRAGASPDSRRGDFWNLCWGHWEFAERTCTAKLRSPHGRELRFLLFTPPRMKMEKPADILFSILWMQAPCKHHWRWPWLPCGSGDKRDAPSGRVQVPAERERRGAGQRGGQRPRAQGVLVSVPRRAGGRRGARQPGGHVGCRAASACGMVRRPCWVEHVPRGALSCHQPPIVTNAPREIVNLDEPI